MGAPALPAEGFPVGAEDAVEMGVQQVQLLPTDPAG